jgi:hypothetical protein
MILALFAGSCGRESIRPLYAVEPLKVRGPIIRITSTIDLTAIPENAVTSFFSRFFDWVPGLGQLFEIPLDMIRVVLPPLTAKQFPELPEGASWRDPKVLRQFSSIKLISGYLRAPGEEELKARLSLEGKEYKGKKCRFLIFFCDQPGVEFLSELRLYMVFGQDLSCMDRKDCPKNFEAVDVLLARADVKDKSQYFRNPDGTEWINFVFENANIRSYMERYNDFRVKIIAEGKPPTREAYVEGAFTVELALQN